MSFAFWFRKVKKLTLIYQIVIEKSNIGQNLVFCTKYTQVVTILSLYFQILEKIRVWPINWLFHWKVNFWLTFFQKNNKMEKLTNQPIFTSIWLWHHKFYKKIINNQLFPNSRISKPNWWKNNISSFILAFWDFFLWLLIYRSQRIQLSGQFQDDKLFQNFSNFDPIKGSKSILYD